MKSACMGNSPGRSAGMAAGEARCSHDRISLQQTAEARSVTEPV